MSNAWDALARFKPEKLAAAAQRVAEFHAVPADSSLPASPDVVSALRERLRATDLELIDELAGRLRRVEIHAVADLLAGREEASIVEKAVRLGLVSKVATLRKRSWRLAVEAGPSDGLHSILRGFADEGSLRSALELSSGDFERVQSWLGAPSIQEGLLLDRRAHPTGDCAYWRSLLPQTSPPIIQETPLWSAFRVVFLTQAPAELLIGEGVVSLLSMAKECGAATQEKFARHYLIELRSPRRWNEAVFEWISGRFGDLDLQNPVDFWRRTEQLSEGILRELAAWRALRTLESFFKSVRDPHGRFAFWKDRFGDQIVGAGTAAGGQAAYLHLPPLVVVEFANVGNAAYVYPDSNLGWIESRRSPVESSYKDRKRLARLPGSNAEARIIHSDGWQLAAAGMLNRLIKAGRGR